MSDQPLPPDLIGLMGALVISVISGTISITQRIVRGREASILWVTSEYLSAALAGYLMYTVYPSLADDLPKWANLPVMVAVVAHFGGRTFQGLESFLIQRYKIPVNDRRQDSSKKD